jgi:hypothetical protein
MDLKSIIVSIAALYIILWPLYGSVARGTGKSPKKLPLHVDDLDSS